MNVQLFVMQILNGLSSGMIIFLIAVGLSIIFGALKVLNLAHAAINMLGAYLCYWLSIFVLAKVPGHFWLVLFIAPLATALFGGLIEVFLIRRIYGQNIMYQFILTFGLALIVGDLCKLLWGREVRYIPIPWPFEGSVPILGAHLIRYQLILYLAGVLVLVGLVFLFNRTKLGSFIRAVTYNRDVANALGVNVPFVYTSVFMLGCWLAAFGGVISAPLSVITLGMDHTVLVQCFIVVVIGGMGSIFGAFIGSIILGLMNSFGIIFLPELALVFSFMLMAIILIVRPYGLMGEPMEAEEELK
jgi:branched-subunit amino acid ABC-type transport system permease component